MNKVSLCMVFHSHQPVGNFDHVIEEAFERSYQPFLSTLARYPRVRLSLHFSGILFSWLKAHRPEFMEQLRELTLRGQVEHVGGGFYEPILAAIPPPERVTQILRQSDFLKQQFGATPAGAWIAERVWEQGLIPALHQAGVRYTIMDHTHFLGAGLDAPELHEAYLTEEVGLPLTLVPSLQTLRYTIPFREPEETLAILRTGVDRAAALFAVGDDCEKLGIWPGTYDHCYTHGWLGRFFEALERAAEWLEVTTVSDYLAAHPPTRCIYLPTGSYEEMMTWALPTPAAIELENCYEEACQMPNGEHFRRFLRGGPWLNFLSKYPESNQTQKLVLRAFRRWHDLNRTLAPGAAESSLLVDAQDHLLAAQCNDAYWHGIFGGLYAPHLRGAVLRHLIQAESLIERASGAPGNARIEVTDFDVDGHDEVLVEAPGFALVARPADGGTISSLRFMSPRLDIVNSLMRRPEAYHQKMGHHQKAENTDAPVSIHDRALSKGEDLGAALQYDRYSRHAFRTYLFPAERTWQDFQALKLEECEELARGHWKLHIPSAQAAAFELQMNGAVMPIAGGEARVRALKSFKIHADGFHWFVGCEHKLLLDAAQISRWDLGVELVFNLLAPNRPDRYFEAGGERHPLGWQGEIIAPALALVDEWEGVKITLAGPQIARWWITPIQTLSQSESGLERIYQGSAILAVWEIELGGQREARATLEANIESLAQPQR
ncbi:MAG: alpha-amylase/4-alpha-glucanotransferase domain-containing protein [Terriglobia bacterium]